MRVSLIAAAALLAAVTATPASAHVSRVPHRHVVRARPVVVAPVPVAVVRPVPVVAARRPVYVVPVRVVPVVYRPMVRVRPVVAVRPAVVVRVR